MTQKVLKIDGLEIPVKFVDNDMYVKLTDIAAHLPKGFKLGTPGVNNPEPIKEPEQPTEPEPTTKADKLRILGIQNKTTELRIRSTPSKKRNTIIDYLPRGDRFEVLDSTKFNEDMWYKVKSDNHRTGWIHSDYVTVWFNFEAKDLDISDINWVAPGKRTEDTVFTAGYQWTARKTIYGNYVKDGKIISNNQPHWGSNGQQLPAAVLMITEHGNAMYASIQKTLPSTFEFKTATSGLAIWPDCRNVEGGFTGSYSDVMSRNDRIVVMYSKKHKELLAVVMNNMSINEARQFIKSLDEEYNIPWAYTCDGGGSTYAKVRGILLKDTSRPLGIVNIVK